MVKVYTSIANTFTESQNFTASFTATNYAVDIQAGITNTVGHLVLAADTGCYVVSTVPLYMCDNKIVSLADPTENQDAATKYYVDNCGGGGSSFWADGTNPYIVPCNSCGLCMSNDIVASVSAPCVGIASSPGAFAEFHGACGEFTTRVASPMIYAGSGLDICLSGAKTAEFGTTCTCLATIRTKDIHAYSNGSCCVGISACRFLGGYINNIYACRKLVIPVGVNCY